ncbi:hypothetical protein [Blautia sp. 1033sp1_1033st1_G9_1033SCRN_220408]|uniref:hypothetical protein n=1 Tax=Blautia sp. 1033sp1_1033st1_G9_1033SCRN_220408 TaxID=3144490 RepID=UPI0034A24B36
MKIGDVVYIVESNRYIRKVQIVRIIGNMYLIRFLDNGGGIQVRENRLFPTQELAENSIKRTIHAEKKVP